MEHFELQSLLETLARSGRLYHEFIRKESLSVGLYVLAAGATDPQSPHTEDEVYYVIEGRGQIQVGGESRAVVPGTTVFVAAGVDHRFHTIEEELKILVFFAPAEYSKAKTERALV